MSPDESQLRAALRAGEGQQLDADTVLARARGARRDRRRTWTAVGGAVLVVGAVAGVLVGVANGGSSRPEVVGPAIAPSSSGAGSHGPVAPPPGPQQPSATKPVPAPAEPSRSAAPPAIPPTAGPSFGSGAPAPCPPAAPPISQPAHGGSGPLFPSTVVSLRLCVYQPAGSQVTPFAGSKLLDGAAAQATADQLDGLATTSPAACAAIAGPQLVIFAVDADRRQHTVLGDAGGCGLLTDGTNVRYGRDPLVNLIGATIAIHPPQVGNAPGPGPS